MKILIFSDTHLKTKFDESKFIFLKEIIEKADKVIIAGDFWEGLQISFDEFVTSPWKALFPYLRNKNTIYVFGNHDKREWTNNQVSLFSIKQTNQYTFNSGNKIFAVEHGDRFRLWHVILTRNISSIITFFTHKNPNVGHQLERLGFQLFGKDFHQRLGKKVNNVIKNQIKKEFIGNRILICGHTHAQELDIRNNFINTGMVMYGVGQYIIVDNGNVLLKETNF